MYARKAGLQFRPPWPLGEVREIPPLVQRGSACGRWLVALLIRVWDQGVFPPLLRYKLYVGVSLWEALFVVEVVISHSPASDRLLETEKRKKQHRACLNRSCFFREPPKLDQCFGFNRVQGMVLIWVKLGTSPLDSPSLDGVHSCILTSSLALSV